MAKSSKAKKTSSGAAAGLSSMTGFGKASLENATIAIDVEIKSVNSRYLDPIFRLPREYSAFEADIREALQKNLFRGRVELVVSRLPRSEEACALDFNSALFERYHSIYSGQLRSRGKLDSETETKIICDILARKEVLHPVETLKDPESERRLLVECVNKAVAQLCKMRQGEGANLESEVRARLKALASIVKQIDAGAKSAPKELRQAINQRLSKYTSDLKLEPSRLAQEVVMAVERLDVTEELVRLRSHMLQLEQSLSERPAGRKLDFVLQECGRELNTIGSKVQNATIQGSVVNAKVELEKIREQIQNVE